MDLEKKAQEIADEVVKGIYDSYDPANMLLHNAGIPDDEHYRISDQPERCMNCVWFKDGHCEKWNVGVNPDAICDEWSPASAPSFLGG